VTKIISVMPLSTISSTTYCKTGLFKMGSISLGMALVAGKKRVPAPATGIMALRMECLLINYCLIDKMNLL